MATINNLKVGQILYSNKGFPVEIIVINIKEGYVLGNYNNNFITKYNLKRLKTLKVNRNKNA